jgi:hypothetical protein
MEMRMARLEGAFEQIDRRLGALEARMDSMARRIDTLLSMIEARFSRLEEKVDRQFYWVVGLVLISILVPISLRLLPLR